MHKQIRIQPRLMFLALSVLLALAVSVSPAHAKKDKDAFKNCNSKNAQHICNSSLSEKVYDTKINTSYDLINNGVFHGTDAASSDVTVNGVNISIAAFADTQNVYNEFVVGASLEKISDRWAYGVTNNDEAHYYGWSDHAIDNVNHYSQGSDNAKHSGMTNVERDYDFVLLSFDSAVTLTGAGFSWVANTNDTQVSVASLSSISTLTSGVSTWSDIVADALTAASFDIKSSGNPNYAANFTFKEAANYWLVGAYNTVFGDIGGYVGNDAFKLANISFSPESTPAPESSTEVAEPTTIGLLAGCSLFIVWRRKQFPA